VRAFKVSVSSRPHIGMRLPAVQNKKKIRFHNDAFS